MYILMLSCNNMTSISVSIYLSCIQSNLKWRILPEQKYGLRFLLFLAILTSMTYNLWQLQYFHFPITKYQCSASAYPNIIVCRFHTSNNTWWSCMRVMCRLQCVFWCILTNVECLIVLYESLVCVMIKNETFTQNIKNI